MGPTSLELTLEEMLADPIVQLVMRSDNIVADDVRRAIHGAREAHRRRDLRVERYIGLVHDTLNGSINDEGSDQPEETMNAVFRADSQVCHTAD